MDMLEIITNERNTNPNILVIGVGGGGNNALNRMIENNQFPVKYVAVNTDRMVLDNSLAEMNVMIGEKLTCGYGAGGNPEVGAASAEESAEELENIIKGNQLVIITGGMGGGTGTGAIPVIAKICKEQKVLSVAVVTMPFNFEGKKKMQFAQTGIATLRENIDTLLVIPNEKLLEMNDKALDLDEAFLLADSVLKNTINAITNIIYNCGVINLDFNDLKSVLSDMGDGHLGISTDNESGDIIRAVDRAIHSPLLETDLRGAKNILINCAGKFDLKKLNEAIQHLQKEIGEDTYVMWGTVSPKDADDRIEVTIIATGLKSVSNGITEKKFAPKEVSGTVELKVIKERYGTTSVESKVKQRELVIPSFLRDMGK